MCSLENSIFKREGGLSRKSGLTKKNSLLLWKFPEEGDRRKKHYTEEKVERFVGVGGALPIGREKF